MSLSPQDLLTPRVICIGTPDGTLNYPGSPFKSGEILIERTDVFSFPIYVLLSNLESNEFSVLNDNRRISLNDIDLYPHLFKRLKWWQNRDAEEMPEYVKHYLQGEVYKVDGYNKAMTKFYIGTPERFREYMLKYFLPATLTEYNEYLKTK